MTEVVEWSQVFRDRYGLKKIRKECTYIVYQIDRVPDFSDYRYEYLCKERDQRMTEVIKKQMLMLRQFHSLGPDCGIALRLVKLNGKLNLYIVFRILSDRPLSEEETERRKKDIRNRLIGEYTFGECEEIQPALEVPWAEEVTEIIKYEQEYSGDEYPAEIGGGHREFYMSGLWASGENTLDNLCSAMILHTGNIAVDVTLIPTGYLDDEKNWINENLIQLKESMNGETYYARDGHRKLWEGKKLPILKVPLDNYEKLNKQYESSRMFLTAVRVFAQSDSRQIADVFMDNAVRTKGSLQHFRRGFPVFAEYEQAYRNVTVTPTVTLYWNRKRGGAPFRAQRLNRLCAAEEISNFFRLPVAVTPTFPGFMLDRGLGEKRKDISFVHPIRLGNYLDETSAEAVPADFEVQQLVKHGLIVGVPGSGKTTAMFNILYQLWAVPREQRIPFIVLEPAKTEYRALMTLPEFKDDLLIFTLGDESVSPFRFNPMEVPEGIKLETHISKLQACFVGAFDMMDPLPIVLEKAIRATYDDFGWYDDSIGGEPNLVTPTLSDLCDKAEEIVRASKWQGEVKSNIEGSLLERLNTLRRGSKGKMLDTKKSIPMEDLMNRPVILELDSLNGDEKSLLMMFLLNYVYEYCKVKRKSGSPLKHMLLVEEAHNLIGADAGSSSRGNPKEKTIELFVNMLAEMRALGQGILIADQLPTAIAPQAVKQTNVKVLMRVTAQDDREVIGNTMDLNEEQMHQVVHFKTGHAYVYHEGEELVRMIRMVNFKGEHTVEEPPGDEELREYMHFYEESNPELYMPLAGCPRFCTSCDRRLRSQIERVVRKYPFGQERALIGRYVNTKVLDEKMIAALLKDPKMRIRMFLTECGEEKKILKRRREAISENYDRCAMLHALDRCLSMEYALTAEETRSETDRLIQFFEENGYDGLAKKG